MIVSLFKVTIDSTTSPINTAFVGVTEVIKKQTNKQKAADRIEINPNTTEINSNTESQDNL